MSTLFTSSFERAALHENVEEALSEGRVLNEREFNRAVISANDASASPAARLLIDSAHKYSDLGAPSTPRSWRNWDTQQQVYVVGVTMSGLPPLYLRAGSIVDPEKSLSGAREEYLERCFLQSRNRFADVHWAAEKNAPKNSQELVKIHRAAARMALSATKRKANNRVMTMVLEAVKKKAPSAPSVRGSAVKKGAKTRSTLSSTLAGVS
jgi:hypothetical protein